MLDPAIQAHYDLGIEQQRLTDQSIELVRSKELLLRYLPAAPASVLDVGGGPGVYAAWLAELGYQVHLVDPVARHVDEAAAQAKPFTASIGDARQLEAADCSFDAVLLMGPLYHLTQRSDRLRALGEARRVVRLGGRVLAVGISRFASLFDGLRSGQLADARFRAMVERDLASGQHRNPAPDEHPEWFTTAYFHHPLELGDELRAAGLEVEAVLAIEGPGWMMSRIVELSPVLEVARATEAEPSLIGATSHLLAIGRCPS